MKCPVPVPTTELCEAAPAAAATSSAETASRDNRG
jgi:hypothetical protein